MGNSSLIIPNWDRAIFEIGSAIKNNPTIKQRAHEYGKKYEGERGLMVVDVVSSRQRRYESHVVAKLLPLYVDKAKDLSLRSLSVFPPYWLPLRDGEADTMSELGNNLLSYGESVGLEDEEAIVKAWAVDEYAHQKILEIKGIGPALLQYLRMRCGADSLKVDVRVLEELSSLGLPTEWFTVEGVLELCKEITNEIGCTLLELDQVLWHRSLSKK